MTTAIVERQNGAVLERVVAEGDIGALSPKDRVAYYLNVCDSLGLNPTTKPFEYIKLNGKLTLYARKDCTDQLRHKHHVSVKITGRDRHDDVYVVTAQASMPDGRTDESIGAVPIANLKGEALANALMKAETKSKRRVTLSICGLGYLDESEVASIPDAEPVPSLPAVKVASPEQRERIDELLKALKVDGKKALSGFKRLGVDDPKNMTADQAEKVIEALLAKQSAEKPTLENQRCSVQKEQLILALCKQKRQLPEDMCEFYHVKKLSDLTEAQATDAIEVLEKMAPPADEDERQPGDEDE